MNATKQRLLGFALTGPDGTFCFRNLPFGTYYVMADVPRFGRGMVEQITLSPEQPSVAGLHLYITDRGRVAMRYPCVTEPESGCSVFPNPAEAEVVVSGLQSLEEYTLTVTDAMGKLVLPQRTLRADLTGECAVSVDGLRSGVYFLQVDGKSARKMIKFVKY